MEKRDTPCCEEAIIHADTLMQVKSLLIPCCLGLI